jgi:hypothetical protein
MKKHFATLLLLIAFISSKAIVGVYLTYDDFKSGTLQTFDGESFKTAGAFLNKTISGKVKGEQKTFNLKDIYGINLNGELYRIYNDGHAIVTAKLYSTADYQLYFHSYDLDAANFAKKAAPIGYLSKGLDGEIFRLSTMDALSALGATHPELKDLIKACEKLKLDAAGRVSRVIYNSPNFKMGKDIIPPVKK